MGSKVFGDLFDIYYLWAQKSIDKGLGVIAGLNRENDLCMLGKDRREIRHLLLGGLVGEYREEYLHSLICSTVIDYAPSEVQIWLFSKSNGLFDLYSESVYPHIAQVITGDREGECRFVKLLHEEVQNRLTFLRENKVPSLEVYRREHKVKVLPDLLVVLDELKLMRRREDDDLEYQHIVEEIFKYAWAVGLTIVLASQAPIFTFDPACISRFDRKATIHNRPEEYMALLGRQDLDGVNTPERDEIAVVTEDSSDTYFTCYKVLKIGEDTVRSVLKKSARLYGVAHRG